MRILGISGSLRSDSYNAKLLALAAKLLPPEAELVRFEGLKAIPPYDQDEDREPLHPAVADLRAQIAGADALLVATPEYNSSIPGQLKNAIDWASRPLESSVLRNKDAAVIGASTSMFGAVWAQAELRKVLAAAGGRVIDRELAVARADGAFHPNGELRDPDLIAELGDILAELRAEATRSQGVPIAA
jgi:chromate reductase